MLVSLLKNDWKETKIKLDYDTSKANLLLDSGIPGTPERLQS